MLTRRHLKAPAVFTCYPVSHLEVVSHPDDQTLPYSGLAQDTFRANFASVIAQARVFVPPPCRDVSFPS
jgi:hypothetical protein